MGKLTRISIVLQDEGGQRRLVEFMRPEKINGILDDHTSVGDFIKDCAGHITTGSGAVH